MSMSVGKDMLCYIKGQMNKDGDTRAYCTGKNTNHRISTASPTTTTFYDTQLMSTRANEVEKIAVMNSHICMIYTDKKPYCSGSYTTSTIGKCYFTITSTIITITNTNVNGC